jgi:hypothetical protein
MPKLIDLTGKTYNRLIVIRRDTERSGVYWICRCECGNIVADIMNEISNKLVKDFQNGYLLGEPKEA